MSELVFSVPSQVVIPLPSAEFVLGALSLYFVGGFVSFYYTFYHRIKADVAMEKLALILSLFAAYLAVSYPYIVFTGQDPIKEAAEDE